jgi:hypothetical protein
MQYDGMTVGIEGSFGICSTAQVKVTLTPGGFRLGVTLYSMVQALQFKFFLAIAVQCNRV